MHKIPQRGTFLKAITGLEPKGHKRYCAITGVEATTNQSCMAFYENEKMKTDFLFQWYLYYGEYLALDMHKVQNSKVLIIRLYR